MHLNWTPVLPGPNRASVNRIMIIGQPGSGKSTLARALGDLTGLPAIHVDKIHWQPGWVERSKAEKTRLCEEAAQGSKLISENGHSATWPGRLALADMLICLDPPGATESQVGCSTRPGRIGQNAARHGGGLSRALEHLAGVHQLHLGQPKLGAIEDDASRFGCPERVRDRLATVRPGSSGFSVRFSVDESIDVTHALAFRPTRASACCPLRRPRIRATRPRWDRAERSRGGRPFPVYLRRPSRPMRSV